MQNLADAVGEQVHAGVSMTRCTLHQSPLRIQEREHHPPYAGAGHTDAHGQSRILHNHEQAQIQQQQQTATQVAQGPAARTDIIPLVGRGDLGQETVVENNGPAKSQIGDDEQQTAGGHGPSRAKEGHVGTDEKEQDRGECAGVGKGQKHPLLQMSVVSDGSQQR